MKINLVGQILDLDLDEPRGEGVVREVFYTRGSLMYSGHLPIGTIEVTDAPHVYVYLKRLLNGETEATPAILYRSGSLALMGFSYVGVGGEWIEAFASKLTNLVVSHVYGGEAPTAPVQPSAALDVIALREAAERGEPMRAEDTLALLNLNERNFRVAVELSEPHRSYTPRYADPVAALNAALRQTAQEQAGTMEQVWSPHERDTYWDYEDALITAQSIAEQAVRAFMNTETHAIRFLMADGRVFVYNRWQLRPIPNTTDPTKAKLYREAITAFHQHWEQFPVTRLIWGQEYRRRRSSSTPVTTEALIGRKVRIQTTADLSDWHWKYQEDVEECRDLNLEGKIEQANDERGSWWAFVTFAGRNGHWLPLTALTFSEPHR